MTSRKAPHGYFSQDDLEIHRSNMEKIIPLIHEKKGNGLGVSAPRNLSWYFPSLREPRIGLTLGSWHYKAKETSEYLATWDSTQKEWKTEYVGVNACEWVRSWYTEGACRKIGKDL